MRKQFLHLLTISVLALFVCITFDAASADAYGLTQQNLSKNSITVSWEPESRATAYIVYAGANYSSLAEYARLPVSENSVTIQNVPAGSERCISVKYECLTYSGSTGSMSVGQGTYKTLPVLQRAIRFLSRKKFPIRWSIRYRCAPTSISTGKSIMGADPESATASHSRSLSRPPYRAIN